MSLYKMLNCLVILAWLVLISLHTKNLNNIIWICSFTIIIKIVYDLIKITYDSINIKTLYDKHYINKKRLILISVIQIMILIFYI